MDVVRPDADIRRRRRRLRTILGIVLSALVLGGTWVSLPQATVSVERAAIIIDTVRRGPLVRQVHATGILVPEHALLLVAETGGRVARILARPGDAVNPGTCVLLLTNPEVEQASLDAEGSLVIAEAELANLLFEHETRRMDLRGEGFGIEAELIQARLRAEAAERLAADGLISEIDRRILSARLEEASRRLDLSRERLAVFERSAGVQLAAKRAEVEKRRNFAQLRQHLRGALQVRAGMKGTLQALIVEGGQQVSPGAPLARVADPDRLLARVRIQAADVSEVEAGMPARIEMGTAVVNGSVAHVEPTVVEGLVAVDLTLAESPPREARPDLPVQAVIDVERIPEAVFVGQPALSVSNGPASVFRLDSEGRRAVRVEVRLGRASGRSVEILDGLEPGARIIVSDTSRWAGHARIRIED